MSEDDDSEKEHEPTERRISEARKRGEIARSPDLNTAAGYAGMLVAASIFGPVAMLAIGDLGVTMIDQSHRLAQQVLVSAALPAGMTGVLVLACAPFLLGPLIGVVMLLAATRGVVFAPDRIAPKLSRISPLANAQQRFGPDGLFEFVKSAVKLCLVSFALGLFLNSHLPRILAAVGAPAGAAMVVLLELMRDFLVIVLIMALCLGLIDYLWQRMRLLKRLRMSRQELIEEHKDSEGDPHVKAQRRQRGRQIAMNRMLADVPKADVVIVNPSHYAVALQWKRGSGKAPVCLAKGVDEMAARIRAAAAEAGVPLHSDPPTARALFAAVELGQQIRPEHYRAVAAALRFAERMRRRVKERRGW